MDPKEYERLDTVDRDHWFYRGKRDIVRHWIARYRPLRPSDLLIDGGCGTGRLLQEMSAVCRVVGLDDHAESITLAAPKIAAAGGSVVQASLTMVPFSDADAAVVTLLDVLEHLDNDASALDEMIRLVQPGGLIVITVPALRWLWSDWDIALHHRRRYSLPDFKRLIHRPGTEVLRCTYFNFLALPAMLLVRTWRTLFPAKRGEIRAEDRVPPMRLNRFLHRILVRPACWSWFRPPIGPSLIAILRRIPERKGCGAS